MSFDIHPLAELIPPMTDAEYEELKADIAENGLSQAITLYEGKVLDGRHRAKACLETGADPSFTEYEGDTPAQYVISLNVRRRQLTTSQRAAIAVDFLPVLEEEARKRQSLAGQTHGRGLNSFESSDTKLSERKNSRSYQEAGDLVGVGEATVGRAKRVKREDPDEFERVRRGEVTVAAAHSKVSGENKAPKPVHPIETDRQRQLAEKAKLRMEKAVGMAAGISSGYPHLRPDRALAVATPEEVNGWLSVFDESVRAIRNLKKQVEDIR